LEGAGEKRNIGQKRGKSDEKEPAGPGKEDVVVATPCGPDQKDSNAGLWDSSNKILHATIPDHFRNQTFSVRNAGCLGEKKIRGVKAENRVVEQWGETTR